MKKVFFGVAVAAIALSASAFTVNKSTGDRYVQLSDNQYTFISAGSYNPSFCEGTDNTPCSVQVTEAGHLANIEALAPFTDAQVITWSTQSTPYLTVLTSNAIYNP